MEFEFLVDGAVRKISLTGKNGIYEIRDGEAVIEAEIRAVSADEFLILAGGKSILAAVVRDGERRLVSVAGMEFVLGEPRPASRFGGGEDKAHGGSLDVRAPMPGKVIQIKVREGEEVRKNQTLAIVEAMKMENEIKAAGEAVVKKVCVAVGDLVDPTIRLIELEAKTPS
jgi:biotin carboxyl carrier protein